MAHLHRSIAASAPRLPRRTPLGRLASPLLLLALAALALQGCALDSLLISELTREGNRPMPDPAPVRIHGRAPGLAGAAVTLLAEGQKVGEATADAAGQFVIELDGTTAFNNPVLDVRAGGKQALGVLPAVPAQTSVLDPAIDLDVAQLSPGMAALDARTTTLALLVLAKARATQKDLQSIPMTSMTDTLIDLNDRLLAKDAALSAFAAMVGRLSALPGSTPPFQLNGDSAKSPSFLAQSALGGGFDYTGDGTADTTTAAFDAALAAAVGSFNFKACYVPDQIRVVILARMADAPKNRNCETFNPYLWAKDIAGRRMFIAAGVHPDTPRCVGERTSHCLSEQQIDALNKLLGDWKPNRTRMYDDGTHGDAKAGDSVWTFSFVAPWWDATQAPDKAGVRVAYKFTWGNDGDGWTNTEEFPGNQRILELSDQNGDQVIVRYDLFGDETSNKDKANGLAPSLGGCGKLKWPSEQREGCATDVHERQVDLDGDCKVDGWPSAGPNPALTIPCK